jgi:hypothetical protein
MASAWAEDAEWHAKAMTRDLIEVGKVRGFRVTYHRREARFALRTGDVTHYFGAHDYETPEGDMDWLRLRIDVLTQAAQAPQHVEPDEAATPFE